MYYYYEILTSYGQFIFSKIVGYLCFMVLNTKPVQMLSMLLVQMMNIGLLR